MIPFNNYPCHEIKGVSDRTVLVSITKPSIRANMSFYSNATSDGPRLQADVFDSLMERAGLPFRQADLIGWGNSGGTNVKVYRSWRVLYVHKEGQTYGIDILFPEEISPHWLMGTYYGYPQCCIADHQHMLDESRRIKSTVNFELRKQQLKEADLLKGGPLWCLKCIEEFKPDTLEQVTKHRLSPKPLFNDSPSVLNFLHAITGWLDGKLKPWSAH